MTGVLDGVRVLDFSRIFAGPDSAQMLGDLGADVIKIEKPDGGDDCRRLGVTSEELDKLGGPSPSFRSFNRNKRSLTIDLSTAEGVGIAKTLINSADVIINNFRPGTMERWGLGYEDMKPANPGLVYCDFHAYGPVGPMAHIGANDLALQAHSGLMSITGEEGGPPARAGSAIVDLHASLAIVSAVLAALLNKEKTGKGQRVDTSLLLSSAHLMSYFYQDYWLTGSIHHRMGTANHLSVPNQAFPTVDGFVVIIAPSDEMWQRCATALDPKRLDIEEFKTASERLRLRADLVYEISEITKTMKKQDIHKLLSDAKVNVSIVNNIDEAAQDAQLEAVGGVYSFEKDGKSRNYVAMPFRLHDTPGKMRRNFPELGEHTDEILSENGYSAQDIAAFRKRGTIGQ